MIFIKDIFDSIFGQDNRACEICGKKGYNTDYGICELCYDKAMSNIDAMDEFLQENPSRYMGFVKWYFEPIFECENYSYEMLLSCIRDEQGTPPYNEGVKDYIQDDEMEYVYWYKENEEWQG